MTEGIGETLHALGDVVEGIEAAGGSVSRMETAPDEDGLTATIDVALPLAAGADLTLALEEASLVDGDLRVRLSATSSPASGSVPSPAATSHAAAEPADDPAGLEADTSGTDVEGGPAYQDPERLRAVYEAHDSFPAMTAALDVDVTPQTVRRHMIEHGIHDPEAPPDEQAANPVEEPPDAPEEPATEATDGGTPATEDAIPSALGEFGDRSLDEVKEAVRDARTIRELGQRLDVPRERAFRLLNTLGLVDLVSGRLRSADRRISAEELDERIERATAEE